MCFLIFHTDIELVKGKQYVFNYKVVNQFGTNTKYKKI